MCCRLHLKGLLKKSSHNWHYQILHYFCTCRVPSQVVRVQHSDNSPVKLLRARVSFETSSYSPLQLGKHGPYNAFCSISIIVICFLFNFSSSSFSSRSTCIASSTTLSFSISDELRLPFLPSLFREATERLATTSFDTSKILRRGALSFLLLFWLFFSFHRVPLLSDWPLVFEMGRCSPNPDDLLFLCISRPYNNWSKQTKDSLEYHGCHRDNFAHATIRVDVKVSPPCGDAYSLKNASVDYT